MTNLARLIITIAVIASLFGETRQALAMPTGTQVLYYSSGVMERVYQNHMNPRFARTGDYVPTLHRRPGVDCLTAVSWQTHSLVAQSKVLVIDFWDRVQGRWERHNCAAADWQMRRDSTGSRQRFEIDWGTAVRVHAVPGNTVARLIGIY